MNPRDISFLGSVVGFTSTVHVMLLPKKQNPNGGQHKQPGRDGGGGGGGR